tara:strand:+ start:235 stop:462 length:228 start_codon:yes stop_codon:yes gene_type:complete
MITLSVGFGNGTITILLILIVILVLMIFRKQDIFKGLAIVNKTILPSLISKDLSKLKGYEKLIFGYRYWVTKNSL